MNDYEIKYQESRAAWFKEKESFVDVNALDTDGYPTVEILDIISRWHWCDAKDYFAFIKELWAYSDSGYWEEEIVTVDDFSGRKYNEQRIRYNISTAGWSGNESIIRAMQNNEMMWHLNWVQSRRGGHYIFELTEFDE